METYHQGKLQETDYADPGDTPKGEWECAACSHTWYWPPRVLKVRIELDEDPESPREMDCLLGHMVCFHGRHNLGDKTDLKESMFDGWEEVEQHLVDEYGADYILPLYLMDHSGITIRTGPFSCGWDSGQVGFIYTTKKRAAELGVAEEHIESQLKDEVEVYDKYLRGDVWGYTLEDEDGEFVDECGGFYGREAATEAAEEAKQYLEGVG